MKIKQGDTVKIITGKDEGMTGVVDRSLPEEQKVVVSGANIAKMHKRGSGNTPGGIVEKPVKMDVSNVMLVCPNCALPTRVGYRDEDGKKVRYCKKCEMTIK